MSTELTLLAWTLVLALVQVMIPAQMRTKEFGLPYGASPRDRPAPVPPGVLTGRMIRAQKNLMETLPVFIGTVLIIQLASLNSTLSYYGAMMYFWGRVVYLPLYAFGIPYIRTLFWAVSMIGLVMLLVAILHPM